MADFPDHRAQGQDLVAYCQGWLARVLREAGRPQEAEKLDRAAIALWQSRIAESPTRNDWRCALSWRYFDLAEDLLKQGRAAEVAKIAEKMAQSAAAIPDIGELRHVAGHAHSHLAQVLQRIDRLDEAEKAYRRALTLFEKLAAEHPDNPAWRVEAAHLDWHLGSLLRSRGRPKEAEQCYRRALGLIERSVAEYPGDRFYRLEYAFNYWLLGGFLKDAGRLPEAETAYRQAVAILEKLVADFPAVAEHRSRLSDNLGALAESLLQQGKHAEVAKVAEKIPGAIPEESKGYQCAADFLSRCVPLAEKDAKLPETDRKAVAKRYADRSKELTRDAEKRSGEKPGPAEKKPKPQEPATTDEGRDGSDRDPIHPSSLILHP